MGTQGVFGYIIGRKKRIIHVQYDADLLWQILVREIYVLMKHYGSKEALQTAFEGIKTTKNNPKHDDIEKCKMFCDFEMKEQSLNSYNWYCLLRNCQNSFINVLESGYINNQKDEYGVIFMLDFNKGSVSFYGKKHDNKDELLETATIEEIMEFEDMPTKTYTEIVGEMNERFTIWYDKYRKVQDELNKLNNLKQDAKKQGAGNIEDKVNKLIDDMEFQKRELNRNRRVFYYRLKALDLIEENTSEK
jgi:hypothetical protein